MLDKSAAYFAVAPVDDITDEVLKALNASAAAAAPAAPVAAPAAPAPAAPAAAPLHPLLLPHRLPALASNRQTGGFLFAACLIAAFCQGGCGRPGPIPAVWSRSREGYVYVGQLLTEHPLYPQYRRLEQEIASLRRPCTLPTTPPVFVSLGELFLPAPEPPTFPLQAFGERERAWKLTLLPGPPLIQPELDPDLTAEVSWARAQARQAADVRLACVTSEEENRLAEVRAEAVRTRQEAFNNAGLDLTVSEHDVEAATERERQRLWADMEKELQAARAQGDARVATAREAILKEFEAAVAAAQNDARERMKSRAEIFVKSGSEMRSRMSKAITPPEPLPPIQGLQWRPERPVIAPGALQPATNALTQRDQQLRLAQAALLAAKRAEIAVRMEEGTERAVRRLAGVRGIRVSFPPTERRAGRDITDELRPALRTMFQY